MILRYLLYAFLAYLAYRFIFGFLIPVARTTRQVKKQFDAVRNQMQEQMQEQMRTQGASSSGPRTEPVRPAASKDDYLEFEEVRD